MLRPGLGKKKNYRAVFFFPPPWYAWGESAAWIKGGTSVGRRPCMSFCGVWCGVQAMVLGGRVGKDPDADVSLKPVHVLGEDTVAGALRPPNRTHHPTWPHGS